MIEYWDGRFPFSSIEPKGMLCGYGVGCGKHINRNGKAKHTPCKKAFYFLKGTTITEDEASLRLKRWLVVGKLHPLDDDQERASHTAIGGRNLRDLASDTDWGAFGHADLDLLIKTL